MQPQFSLPALSTLIVDDEPLAREGLLHFISEDVHVTSILQAKNSQEAISLIRSHRPDIVFLDVQMPEMDGFSVVREIGPNNMPAVVFVTAHDQYALRAFEINAIDYLLKPVTRERCALALARARERLKFTGDIERYLRSLLETLAAPSCYVNRLAIRSAGKTSFVSVEDVQWIQAAENYVQLHTPAGRHMLHVPIGTLQASLDPRMFMRIHRSLIVNIRQIREIELAANGEYVIALRCGERLQSSRTYREKIRNWASNPF
jgi:two-component system, LytTR family, response regulator